MTFLVLEVLSGLEVDCMTEIFSLVQNIYYGGRTPPVNILESLALVYALIVCCQICGWNKNLLFIQLVCNLIRTHYVNRHLEDTLHNSGRVFIYKPLVSCLVPEIAINDQPCNVLAGFAL